MPRDLPDELRELADRQRGVITRRQAIAAGISRNAILSRIESDRWQRLHTGVYVVSPGPADRQAILWAAVLRAGPDAILSHQTAAELDKLVDAPSQLIHVTIPGRRRVEPICGVVLHSRLGCESSAHPARLPPRTRIEETVLDLADSSDDVWSAIGWVTKSVGRRLTTLELLSEALARRPKMRWRKDLTCVLNPDLAGIHSVLEYRYYRDVERPHALPTASRQARAARDGSVVYRDACYEKYAVVVELDGRIAHPGDTRWQDIHRDNAAAALGIMTLRYGYREVTTRPCEIAQEVGDALRSRGWDKRPRRCSATCTLNLAS